MAASRGGITWIRGNFPAVFNGNGESMEGFTGDSIITEFKGLKFPLQWRMDIGWVGGKNGARMALKKIQLCFHLKFPTDLNSVLSE